jgi:Trypsin
LILEGRKRRGFLDLHEPRPIRETANVAAWPSIHHAFTLPFPPKHNPPSVFSGWAQPRLTGGCSAVADARRDPVDVVIGRVSRRVAVAGLWGGLISCAVGPRWSARAKGKKAGGKGPDKAGHHKGHQQQGGTDGRGGAGKGNRKQHPGNNRGSAANGHQKHHKSDHHSTTANGQRKLNETDNRVSADIVGGAGVPANRYPFQIALLDKRNGKKGFNKQFCGGSLIDASHVLTAAHCVAGRATSGPTNLRVLAGVTLLNSKEGQTHQIESITIHPQYDGKTQRYDAAVLRLETPLDTSLHPPIRPAGPGETALETPGTMLTVTGWGNMRQHVTGKKNRNKRPKYSHGLREVQVPVVANDECVGDYGGKGNGQVSPDVMLCAGQAGLDSCSGDSGGPLFVSTPGGYVQVGIVSWGEGCAAPYRPGVYTRVSAVADFIQSATAN